MAFPVSVSGEAIHWLLVEGLLPLFGASILYWLWGACRRTTWDSSKGVFKFSWKGAFDIMGWLYGATVLSMQAGMASYELHKVILSIVCFSAGVICLLLLLSAMTDRSQNSETKDSEWKPPVSLHVVGIPLILAILFAGFEAHNGVSGG